MPGSGVTTLFRQVRAPRAAPAGPRRERPLEAGRGAGHARRPQPGGRLPFSVPLRIPQRLPAASQMAMKFPYFEVGCCSLALHHHLHLARVLCPSQPHGFSGPRRVVPLAAPAGAPLLSPRSLGWSEASGSG